MEKIYLAFHNGNDTTGNGSEENMYKTFEPAKTKIESGNIGQYEIIFTEDTTENCILDVSSFPINQPDQICKITFANSCKAVGSGYFFTLTSTVNHKIGISAVGWNVSGYTNTIVCSGQPNNNFYGCTFLSDLVLAEVSGTSLEYCIFDNISISEIGQDVELVFHVIKNCTFISTDVAFVSSIDVTYNYFDNANITIQGNQTSVDNKTLGTNLFNNCSFRFFRVGRVITSYSLCTTVEQLITAHVLIATQPNDILNLSKFGALTLSANYYQTSTDGYIDGISFGAKNFAATTPHTEFSTVTNAEIFGFLERNAETVDAEFISDFKEFTTVQELKRLDVIYTQIGGGEFPNDNQENNVVVYLMYSATKTAIELENEPENFIPFRSGFGVESSQLDSIPSKIKSYQLKVVLSDKGTTPLHGNFRITDIVLETKSVSSVVENVTLAEINQPDTYQPKPKLSNIIVVGSVVVGYLNITNYSGLNLYAVNIRILVDGTETLSTQTDSKGNVSFDYETNKDITIEISKQGFETVRLLYNTSVMKVINQSIALVKSKPVLSSISNGILRNTKPFDTNNKILT